MSSIRTHSNHTPSKNTLAIAGPGTTDAATPATAAVTAATEATGATSISPAEPAGCPDAPNHGRHRRRGLRRLSLSRRQLARIAVPVAAMLAVAGMLFTAGPLAPGHASASSTPHRLSALWWAEHQAGKWYCWGGTGPSCFDCSGLVMKAYRHAGIRLPRTTYQMLHSSKLVRVRARDRKRGDLAFYGTGHVELVTWHGTFGATTAGQRIGWHHPSRWWHPTMYFRVR